MTSGASRIRRRLARLLAACALGASLLAGCSNSGEGVRDEGPSRLPAALNVTTHH
ncbi:MULTISPECIES: hypothetical protein [Streptomyces]|uniref:Uncharacterized protein n=1 Tax=Streptomyces heilongjiangensis TaxID=945052 RepID=A0ABW1BBK7_9ACTN|nr:MULTISPECIES: hypothetical protein [Streptomyces]MDC2946193.1 hypothetical protein [Streptomyces heilongjiangensis]